MAFNGSGIFNRVYNWTQDAANSIDITASRVDTEDTGFATGLSLCVTRDGQGAMSADFLPSASATYNVGTSASRWLNGNFSGNLTVGGAIIGTQTTAAGTPSLFAWKAFKPAPTSRNGSTILANDPDLAGIVLGASTAYRIDLYLLMQCATTTTQGLSFGLSYSGSAANVGCGLVGVVNNLAVATRSDWTTGYVLTNVNTSATDFVSVTGHFITSTGGTLNLQWAQHSSSGNNTTLGEGSYIVVTQLT